MRKNVILWYWYFRASIKTGLGTSILAVSSISTMIFVHVKSMAKNLTKSEEEISEVRLSSFIAGIFILLGFVIFVLFCVGKIGFLNPKVTELLAALWNFAGGNIFFPFLITTMYNPSLRKHIKSLFKKKHCCFRGNTIAPTSKCNNYTFCLIITC